VGGNLLSRRNCPQEPFPLVEITPESEVAGVLPTQPGGQAMAFAALGVALLLIKASRDENVQRQRVVLPLHFVDRRVHLPHSFTECGERILEAIRAHLFI
jgi:hypothetical protein